MNKVFSSFSEVHRSLKSVDIKNSVVSYDTNCLLDLFRCSSGSKLELVELIENIGDIFGHFLTHHAALEFGLSKDKATNDTKNQLDLMIKSFSTFKKNLNNSEKVGVYDTPLAGLKKELSKSLENIWDAKEKIKIDLNNHAPDNTLFEKVSTIFGDVIYGGYSVTEIESIIAEAEFRICNEIPPGFKDSGKKSNINYYGRPVDSKYGDYLVWRQLIEYSKAHDKDLIFITSEKKPDWMEVIKGEMVVRSDLALEFSEKTGRSVYLCSLSQFEHQFSRKLKYSLTVSAKKELVEIEDANTWFDDVYEAFKVYGREMTLSDVYDYIENNCSRKLQPSWKATVRRTIYNHSSDVDAYLGRRDVFQRLSKGKWALR